MAVTRFEITNRQTYEGGVSFGETGPYERLTGILHYAVDPANERNQQIIDLEHCRRDEHGLVHFSGDFTLLVPKNPRSDGHPLLLELPNRGRRTLLRSVHRAAADSGTDPSFPAGDGFLLQHGFIVGWVGWQWDVYRSESLMGLDAPEAEGVSGTTIVRFHPNSPTKDKTLADRAHRPLPAADVNDPDAVMTVRDSELGEARVIPRDQWRFARDENGHPVPDVESMYLDSGFVPGKVYEVTYRTDRAPIAGAGLMALRDAASFLRFSQAEDNPCSGIVSHAYATGTSQCGRMLRHFIHLGMNLDEENRQVFDGLHPHVAGARRGEFNHRFAQPSVQNTPGFGFLFPYSDEPQRHPDTGEVAGLFDRQRELGGMPRVMYTDSSAEYWRGDGAYTHIDLDGSRDLEPAPEACRYAFASTQHGSGVVPLENLTVDTGSQGRFGYNALDYSPLLRAAIINLHRWVADGIEPPASYHPRLDANTVATEEEVIDKFPEVPGLYRPDTSFLRKLPRVDVGPDVDKGIGQFPVQTGDTWPAFVWDIDADGNEAAPVQLPALAVPVATYTPWNPRHPDTGHPEQIVPMNGSTFFFSRTTEERERLGDPRPSIEERYPDRDAYLARVRTHAEQLAEQRYILKEDIDWCVHSAAERYDEAMRVGPLQEALVAAD